MKKITVIAFFVMAGLLSAHAAAPTLAVSASNEGVKTVAWYMAPENVNALEKKLEECRNNPGQLRDTPDCINAQSADLKKISNAKQPTIKIR